MMTLIFIINRCICYSEHFFAHFSFDQRRKNSSPSFELLGDIYIYVTYIEKKKKEICINFHSKFVDTSSTNVTRIKHPSRIHIFLSNKSI